MGIDCFRMIAALLIVAIHTSPLASFSETGDFIFTRVIARVAVPFFLMTSGYFLISRYSYDRHKLSRFVKKTALIYAAAIVLYIPVNIYTGYFKMDCLLPNIIKDLVFDGTMYHLWYLPASIIGAVIVWYLVKNLSYKKAFVITGILYIVGMFGDSYYGIAEKVSGLKSFYALIFQVSDYTRNGIFFAPVFLLLGAYIADKGKILSLGKSITGFIVSLGLMLCEALALHFFDLQRHDSMYVFLLPGMYFLFNIILHFRGKRSVMLRTTALLIYIIHPLVIIVVRMAAKVLHMESLLIDNSLVYYLAVCLLSVIAAVIFTILWNRIKPQKPGRAAGRDRAYLEINLDNLRHNVYELKSLMQPDCELMAVVKAEAYGHGAYEISTCLNEMGVSAFAVAAIDEGIRLRKYGITGEILILGYTAPERAGDLCRYKLTQTLIDYRYALLLNARGYKLKAHIKVDTGMHRLGFEADNTGAIISAFKMKNIKVTGIFTHLSSADSREQSDIAFTHKQIKDFYRLLDELKKSVQIPKVHIQSSYGLLNYPELKCDYVRVGIALYGVLSAPDDDTRLKPDLRPVLSLKTSVVLLRKVIKGEPVGYNRAYTAGRDSRIAVLPIGYADGYPRSLSCEKSHVIICGKKAPVIGKICMDQLIVDVTDIPEVQIGSEATLIGRDGGAEITAPGLAADTGSISNELLSRMGRRLTVMQKP